MFKIVSHLGFQMATWPNMKQASAHDNSFLWYFPHRLPYGHNMSRHMFPNGNNEWQQQQRLSKQQIGKIVYTLRLKKVEGWLNRKIKSKSSPSNSGSVWAFRIGWGDRVNSLLESERPCLQLAIVWPVAGLSSARSMSARIGAASLFSVVSMEVVNASSSLFFKRCLLASISWSLEDKALSWSRVARFSWLPAAAFSGASSRLFFSKGSPFSRGGRARTKWTVPEGRIFHVNSSRGVGKVCHHGLGMQIGAITVVRVGITRTQQMFKCPWSGAGILRTCNKSSIELKPCVVSMAHMCRRLDIFGL